MNPYRTPAPPTRTDEVRLLADQDPGWGRLRAWAYSDGSTRVRIRVRLDGKNLFIFSTLTFFASVMAASAIWDSRVAGDREAGLLVLVGALAAFWRLLWCLIGGERFLVNRTGMVRRRILVPWRRPEVFLLGDISTTVVSKSGESERLDLQLGRRRVELCRGLGYDGEKLRWIAARLRSAIDHARS